jgi:hypothetical protein
VVGSIGWPSILKQHITRHSLALPAHELSRHRCAGTGTARRQPPVLANKIPVQIIVKTTLVMRRFLVYFLLTIILAATNLEQSKGQYLKVEEFTIFGNRIASPIEMDVRQNDNTLIFNVISSSYYTYDFKIEFRQCQNLSPNITGKRFLIHKGINRLFTLKVVDTDQPPQYEYSIEYVMGSPTYKADLSFPYLIPIGSNRIVNLLSSNEDDKIIYHLNHYKMKQNDTVFCIRKGLVTALPDNKSEVDRIKSSSLEVLHNDGTVAIYEGIDERLINLKLGQIVYPGQPLGQIGDPAVLVLYVCSFQGDGKIQNLNIYFTDEKENLISPERILNKKFTYPISVLKKELTKKELKKFENKTLY